MVYSSASQALGCKVWLQNFVGVAVWDDPEWTLLSHREGLRDEDNIDFVMHYIPIHERRVTVEETRTFIRNCEI